ncbi:hypothetical protein [Xylanimonas sp. McL0601]|uniref:hypothetical protein n=1 Tax=Xylanimonas sp. McL0601 TaxID=3414739 RepID=UPI003CEDE6DA
MNVPWHSPSRTLAATLVATALIAAVAPTAGAAPPAGGPVAAGDDWTITRVAGGYDVTVRLPEKLPVRSDAPTVVVDGESIGIATESADGLALTAFTADPAVAAATAVERGWFSQPSEHAPSTPPGQAKKAPTARTTALADDPAARGPYAWTESIYQFGDQAIPLEGIGGIRGELEGKIYLPTTGGARPTVILLHGRHSSCYSPTPGIPANPNRWPCATSPDATVAQLTIPSFLGYDGTARALASQGYAVVSVSADAINANDNQLAADQGAVARGRLVLDTLAMLRTADQGKPVSYHDAWTGQDVTLDEALTAGTSALSTWAPAFPGGVTPLDAVTARDLKGRFDLTNIGLMGHSRGGEGVTAAVKLNQALANPFEIRSVLPLAPVDFGRMTVPGIPMLVMLPYCDGDVSNQQGQHLLDDSRYAFDDDALRSGVWVMGADHNFFNTVWTPGKFSFSSSDDWSGSAGSARAKEPTCGTDPSVAATSIRLTSDEQYDVGTSVMTAWFRLTMGGETQFLPMFDGSGAVPAALGGADVRSVSTAPSSARSTVAAFDAASPAVAATGAATAVVCASLSGRTTPQELPACSTQPSATVPHWTPASNGGEVPATPVTRLTWASAGDGLTVTLPSAHRSAQGFERISFKAAAGETVPTGTDLTVAVTDGKGTAWTSPVSALNANALVRMPTSASSQATSTLKKIVLQQVDVPVAALAAAGLDVTDLRTVALTGAVGLDGTPAGAAYLSDLAFESSAVGSVTTRPWRTIGVFAPNRAEGDGEGTTQVAVYLDKPSSTPVTAYVSVLGSATGRLGVAMEKVTFGPGQTCQVVSAPVRGDDAPSTTAGTQVKASVVNTTGAVMGSRSIVFTQISEDDGIVPAANGSLAAALPSYGVPGDPCTELAAVQAGSSVSAQPAKAGAQVTLAAGGFRSGESVTFTADGVDPVVVTAGTDGVATATVVAPSATAGATATGAGTGLTARGRVVVKG